ncbi:MAG: endonuclease domain-containing protein [Hyphomonadaceae bacterium]
MADAIARSLRKRLTYPETLLWLRLRRLRGEGLHFRRQSPIGRYIVDFECRAARIVVEIDGSQHAKPDRLRVDDERTAWLRHRGYDVLRFWNNDVVSRTDDIAALVAQAVRTALLLPREGELSARSDD